MTTPKIQNSQLESGGGSGSSDATTAEISYYADGTSGSDSNDGLTALTPKKTLQAVFDLIPFHVRHNVDVNLEGTFTSDTAILDKYVNDGIYLAIDGGSDVTTVLGPYTASAKTAASITTATSVTNYIYCGYWVKMTSGTNSGYIRSSYYNVSNGFNFQKQDMGDNEIGDTFLIVKPATKLTSASSIKISCSGPGAVVAQRMHFDGGTKVWSEAADAEIILSMMTADDSASGPAYSFENCRKVQFASSLYSSGSFDSTTVAAGVSVVGQPSNTMAVLDSVYDVSMSCVHLSKVEFNSCGIGLINEGSCFTKRIDIANSQSIGGSINEPHSFEDTSGYRDVYLYNLYGGPGISNSVDNIYIINSAVGSKKLYVYYSSSHGIQLVNSTLIIPASGVLNGTGHAGAGVYAHAGSTMLISSTASALNIGGPAGAFSTDGSTEKSNWATIQGGTPAIDTNEMTMAKEY